MMCLIIGINSYLLKFVIIKKFMIQLEKKNMDWYYHGLYYFAKCAECTGQCYF